jgi:hypothetical protein
MLMKRNSKRYKEVLEAGCGGYESSTSDGTEFYCNHQYEWVCDNCPITREKHYLEADRQKHKEG